ncbi:ABC transporter permease [Boudabousia liubingyangii]|uniref:ABC transporter permease n=1 Tax=Boudabousia liubingyangii TaxID=1921764 RepID=UPI00093C2998|nr:ABC transporter permease [Boudabousia liubingyangii]
MKRHTEGTPVPWWMIPLAVIGVAFLVIPIVALLLRLPWGSIWELLTAPSSRDALWLSIWTCSVATLACVVFGAPLAIWCARQNPQHKTRTAIAKAIRGLLRLPMVLPPVVAGLVLLQTWGRYGLLGQYLDLFGVRVAFTSVAVVMAQTFVALPFFFASFESALRASGDKYERQARTLGAPSSTIFWKITLPLARPALASAAALAFARALGEFGATLTFAGSLQGVTRTIPLDIYLLREDDTGQALALSLVLIILALLLGSAAMLSGRNAGKPRGRFQKTKSEQIQEPDLTHLPSAGAAPEVSVDLQVPERQVAIKSTFPAGKITAIVGPNGAGKSTLLSALSGTLPFQGQVDLQGATVGVLEQSPILFPHFSCAKNIDFALRHTRKELSQKQRAELVKSALLWVGCDHLAERYPSALSGGEKQRVALARLASQAPQLVLLDEPLSAMDESAAASARSLLRKILEQLGATTLLITHNPQDVLELADWMTVLKSGQVYAQGTALELLSKAGGDPRQARLSVAWGQ